jgi:type IV pilus assembly protein PilA
MSSRRQKGFSLIELLIVVAIILIIAAIAIPSFLRARTAADESSAASSTRTIYTAEITYYNAYPTIGYAAQLTDLGGPEPCVQSSTSACMIPDPLSTAGVATNGKSGYVFSALGIATSGGINDAFVVGAAPVNPGVTGNRLFCTTNDGSIRSDPGPSGTPVTTIAACLSYAPVNSN